MKTRKKLIILTASACAVISAGLGVSTVAWFTANREATLVYQSIRAHATIGDLKISYEPLNNAQAKAATSTDYDIDIGVQDTVVADGLSGKDKDSLLRPEWIGNKATFVDAHYTTEQLAGDGTAELALGAKAKEILSVKVNGVALTVDTDVSLFTSDAEEDAEVTGKKLVFDEEKIPASGARVEVAYLLENANNYVQFNVTLKNTGVDAIGLYFNGSADTIATYVGGESEGDGSSQVRMHIVDNTENATFNKLLSENTEAVQNYVDDTVEYALYNTGRGVVYYDDAAEGTAVSDEALGTGDGSTKVFNLSKTMKPNSDITVTVGGEVKAKGTDYTVSTNRRGVTSVVFNSAPAADNAVAATYITNEVELATTSVVNPADLSYETSDTPSSANFIGNLAGTNGERTLTVTVWFEGTYQDTSGKNDVQNLYNDFGWSLFLDFVTGAAA